MFKAQLRKVSQGTLTLYTREYIYRLINIVNCAFGKNASNIESFDIGKQTTYFNLCFLHGVSYSLVYVIVFLSYLLKKKIRYYKLTQISLYVTPFGFPKHALLKNKAEGLIHLLCIRVCSTTKEYAMNRDYCSSQLLY